MFVESGFSWENSDIVWCSVCGEVDPDMMEEGMCVPCYEQS